MQYRKQISDFIILIEILDHRNNKLLLLRVTSFIKTGLKHYQFLVIDIC